MTYVSAVSSLSPNATAVSSKEANTYTEIEMDFRPEDRTFWCHLAPRKRPSFTQELLADLHRVQDELRYFAATPTTAGMRAAVGWVVLASRTPGIFSLGGDLTEFSRMILDGDREGLRRYAHSCVKIGHSNSSGYGGDAISIGLAQGDALGGGFESLLSCDIIIAEKRARFGLPEIVFGLFPGMGAHAFLGQRIGPVAAQRMILSGRMHSAEEMHAAGVVDVLVENGTGTRHTFDYIKEHEARHVGYAAAHKARRRLFSPTLAALTDVADIWVDAAMQLTEKELRRMALLIAAQDRARASAVRVS